MAKKNFDNDLLSLYASMAKKSYNEPDNQDIEGYKVILSTPHLTDDGFQAVLYGDISTYDEETDTYGKVIIAYRGSMPPNNFNFNELIQDWINNDFKDIVGGDTPRQFESADQFYKQALSYLKDGGKITVTGHSLGGALAQLIAAKYNLEGYTFNAPGVALQAKQKGWNYDNVSNFIIMNDIIGNVRDKQSEINNSGHVGEEYYYLPTATDDKWITGVFSPHSAYNEIQDYNNYIKNDDIK